MNRSYLVASACLAALLTAVGCSNEPEVVDANPDPQAKELAKAPPVTLPPAIRESKTYRCKDNSLVYVSFLDDNLTAMVRDKQEEPPVATLKAPEPGKPFVAEGFSLSGSGPTVTYKSPDSGTLTCKG
jgi:hypothetical protein